MKRLIGDLYKILYQITGNKPLSLGIAIAYISGITMVIIYGLAFLLKGWTPGMPVVLALFRFPWYIALAVIILSLNFWMMTPLQNLSKDKKKQPFVASIVVYSLIAVILYLYSRYF